MTEISPATAALDIIHMHIHPNHHFYLKRQGVKTIGEGLSYLYKSIHERLRGKKRKKYEPWFSSFMIELAYRDALPEALVDDIYTLIFTYPLEWLRCFQQDDGSWENNLDYTIAAALALVRAGNTSKQGRYAGNVARAIQWLEQERELTDITTTYGLVRVLGEHYGMAYPAPPFDLPAKTSPWPLEKVRRWAILQGNAPRLARDIVGLSHFEHDRKWEIAHLYTDIEIAWMIIGAPSPITS